jgi:hypothetical protein
MLHRFLRSRPHLIGLRITLIGIGFGVLYLLHEVGAIIQRN